MELKSIMIINKEKLIIIMQKLELLLAVLLSSCIHTKFNENLNYLKSLQPELIYENEFGKYYKVSDINGKCSIDFEPAIKPIEDPYFEIQPQENPLTIKISLYLKYCL